MYKHFDQRPFNKRLNHQSYLNKSFTLALGLQAKVLAQGRQNSDRGAVKELRTMQAYKNKKSLPIMLFSFQQRCWHQDW